METPPAQAEPPPRDDSPGTPDPEQTARESVRLRVQAVLGGVLIAVVVGLAVFQPADPGAPKRDDARRTLASLRQAIVNFRLDHLAYPWSLDAPPPQTPLADILRELAPRDARLTLGRAPHFNTKQREYIRIDERLLIETSEGGRTLGDPWGRAYRIRLERKAPRLWLWSTGPDGRDGTADDIMDE